MKITTYFLGLLILPLLISCTDRQDDDIDTSILVNQSSDRWILVEYVNAWTNQTETFNQTTTPIYFVFNADETFTKFEPDEDCTTDGTYKIWEQFDGRNRQFQLTYNTPNNSCMVAYSFSPTTVWIEDGQLIADDRPVDGPKLTFNKVSR